MRISELSRHTGIPVSTIKFYIREDLLPAGELSQRNQATYGEKHLQRLDLIRSLRDIAGLSLEVVREVIQNLENAWGSNLDPVGPALQTIYKVPERTRTPAEEEEHQTLRAEIREMIVGLPWIHDKPWGQPVESVESHLYVDQLADAVTQFRKHLDPELSVEILRKFADVAWLFSEVAFDADYLDGGSIVPRTGDDLTDPVRTGILATLLTEPLINPLLRTAFMMRSAYISQGTEAPPTLANRSRKAPRITGGDE